MRMWNVDPKLLCRQHLLLGEHRECHALAGMILKGKKLSGTRYITDGLVEVHNIRSRHDDLVNEMIKRNYDHKSALPEFVSWKEGDVNVVSNLEELYHRCDYCRRLQLTFRWTL